MGERKIVYKHTLLLSSLITVSVDSTIELLDTSTTVLTVFTVDWRFCGWGGRMVTGTAPTYRHP